MRSATPYPLSNGAPTHHENSQLFDYRKELSLLEIPIHKYIQEPLIHGFVHFLSRGSQPSFVVLGSKEYNLVISLDVSSLLVREMLTSWSLTTLIYHG